MAVHRVSEEPASLLEQLRELAAAGDLFQMLLAREIRVRYRQTALGVAWVILQPLVPALIFAAVFGSFARLPSEGMPYFLFALAGLVIFSLFSNAASRAGNAFLRDGQLVSKAYFPRALLPLAAGSGAVVDFAVGLSLVVVLSIATGHATPGMIIAVPIVASVALALGLAFGLAVSALGARYRDFVIAMPFVLQVALYASPIVYSSELVPADLRVAYGLNPLVGLTETFRASVLGAAPPLGSDIALGAAVSGLVVLIGIAVFNRAARDLSDVL